MKKKLISITLATAMVFSLAACSAPESNEESKSSTAKGDSGDLIKAAYLTKDIANETWQLMAEGVISYGSEYGFEVTNMDCEKNAAKQVEQVENCIESGYKVIAISPADYDALDEVCKNAIEKGVHIVSIDGPNFHAQAYVAADEYDNAYGLGKQAAEWVNENWPDKKTIKLAMLEYVYEQACIDRAAGMLDGFKEHVKAEIDIVAEISPSNQAEGQSMGESVFQSTDVDVCLAIAGDNAAGFCTAAEDNGIASEDMMVAAMDISKSSGKLLQEGKYVKLLGSWGSPSVDKAKVHLEAMKEAMDIEGLTDDPIKVTYEVSYVDESDIDQVMKDFGWDD